MKRKVVYVVDKPLTAKERREFSKTHPGHRLCFTLRHPYWRYLLFLPSWILSIVAIIISIVKLLNSLC